MATYLLSHRVGEEVVGLEGILKVPFALCSASGGWRQVEQAGEPTCVIAFHLNS
jgi:hypothetical protein